MDETLKALNDGLDRLNQKHADLWAKGPKNTPELNQLDKQIKFARDQRDAYLKDPERIRREQSLKIQELEGKLEIETDPDVRQRLQDRLQNGSDQQTETEPEKRSRELRDELDNLFAKNKTLKP